MRIFCKKPSNMAGIMWVSAVVVLLLQPGRDEKDEEKVICNFPPLSSTLLSTIHIITTLSSRGKTFVFFPFGPKFNSKH